MSYVSSSTNSKLMILVYALSICVYHFLLLAYIIASNGEEIHVKLKQEMLAVINVGEKPILDSELMRHLPLRYGQSVKADDERISEETRRTRCSRVSTSFF